MEDSIERLQRHEIPGRIAIVKGNGGLAKINITSNESVAEIYSHGAHVTGFQKNGEPPLLFLSRQSLFRPDKPIRGGIPICFPWFGPREGLAQHGFARVSQWDLVETSAAHDGTVKLNFHLPGNIFMKNYWPVAKADFIVTVSDRLTMELVVTNVSRKAFEFEECLHTYFHVGDVREVAIIGLKDAPFLDDAAGAGGARKVEHDDVLKIGRETNRVYPDALGPVEIRDAKFRRVIIVEKSNSASTVVWNPWTTQRMPDFDPEEHSQMLCVESGNAGKNKLSLEPGQTASLKVVLSTRPL